MGSAQSYISSETAVTALIIAGAIGLGYTQYGTPATSTAAVKAEEGQETVSKKGKKKKKTKASVTSGDMSETHSANSQSLTPQPPSSRVVEFPEVIPGQFESSAIAALDSDPSSKDPSAAPSKAKKGKKKAKGKAAASVEPEVSQQVSASIDYLSEADIKASAPPTKTLKRQKTPTQQPTIPVASVSSSSQLKRPSHQSTTSIDTDGSWTRVGSHKRGRTATDADSSALSAEADPTTSDAGLTPSVTGNSSPAVERRASSSTEEESFLLNVSTQDSGEHRRTLAEKLLPKPRKTAVDDMLESSDFPPTLSRVMRVQPLPNEKPATGFSWGDYEDVRVATDGGENDADGEDDGWGVVTSKRSKRNNPTTSSQTHVAKAPETLTKKQRQNALRKESEKAAKVEAEADRLARLEKHKREQQKARMLEQHSSKSSGKTPSGGMKATVDERGKLVWE